MQRLEERYLMPTELGGDAVDEIRAKVRSGVIHYQSLCSNCIDIRRRYSEYLSLIMLTGYCLMACLCDGCNRTADLAMCKLEKKEIK